KRSDSDGSADSLGVSLTRCVVCALASFAVAAPASAAVVAEPSPQSGGTTIYVSAVRGSDRAPGTRGRPLRTVTTAWARVPMSRTLERAFTIVLLSGRWTAA